MNVVEKLEIRGLLRKVTQNSHVVFAPSLAAPVRRRERDSRSPSPAVIKTEEPEVSVPPPVKRARPGDGFARKVLPGLPVGITIEHTTSLACDPIATASRPSRPLSSDSSRSGRKVSLFNFMMFSSGTNTNFFPIFQQPGNMVARPGLSDGNFATF
jgi:hypothetical protein